ncbi:ATP-dependent nuclease [Flavobacterium sp. XS2P12]|uniref:ATP-dependent nuclease n=1 Tax=Flavobacterium melibiosi TaxID=3398734 RepID=UPI003A860ED2
MKLHKLIITNFRGLKANQNIIEFSNSNIIFLIGQNNAGKSTYLRAYEFFTNPSQKAALEDFNNHDREIPIIIEGWFLKEEEDDEDLDLQGSGKNKEPKWVDKWVNEDNIVRVRKKWSSVGTNFEKETFSPLENDWVSNGFGGLDTLFSKYTPTPIAINAMENDTTLEEKVNKLIQDDFIKKMKLEHVDLCDEITSKIKELQSKITGSDAVEQLNTGLNENFQKIFSDLTLKIQASKEENIKIEDAFKKNHTVTVERINSNRTESFLQNGHGVIRQALFNFLAFLKQNRNGAKKEYVILYEEPELFLHPKIAFKLRESLYELAENSPYQIICATHSPLMIDISKPHSSLIRVSKDENENSFTYQVGQDLFAKDAEQKQRVQMINRFNPNICETFYANKVLLVEGDTEAIVYRDLLTRLYFEDEVFVLNTGSKNNIPFFQEILTAFHIEHYAIHDTDLEFNKDGSKNSAWIFNQTIWDNVQIANKLKQGLSRRYVHTTNFEVAHNITLKGAKDKPLKAFQFVQTINRDSKTPDCLKWLDDILGAKSITHDMDYINKSIASLTANQELTI